MQPKARRKKKRRLKRWVRITLRLIALAAVCLVGAKIYNIYNSDINRLRRAAMEAAANNPEIEKFIGMELEEACALIAPESDKFPCRVYEIEAGDSTCVPDHTAAAIACNANYTGTCIATNAIESNYRRVTFYAATTQKRIMIFWVTIK